MIVCLPYGVIAITPMIDLSTIEARKALAGKAASRYGLDVVLVCAQVEQESEWCQWAMRYEPMFYDRYIQPLLNRNEVHTITEATARATSYGLMQVMGQTAREFGFTGQFISELCDPDVGLDYGCRKLKKCLDRFGGNVENALLAYNGGGDPNYARKVLDRMPKYQ